MKGDTLVISQKPEEPSLACGAAAESKAESAETTGRPMEKVKENVCGDVALRGTAMSASSLSAMSFELPPNFHEPSKFSDTPDAMYASSGSSTGTRESEGAYSDIDCFNNPATHLLPKVRMERGTSEKLNAKVSLQKTSRQGRDTQRWIHESDYTIRLVTGCVPILKGGKIMFVSASRKPEWILPKGGWELDEALEESAVRECFEEAGVLGLLGPKLRTVEYETRKAKKRRLEQEEFQRTCVPRTVEKDASFDLHAPKRNESNPIPLLPASLARIRKSAQRLPSDHASDDNSSVATSSVAASTYSKVRMTLFPLYVSRVLEKWPEDGRFRKAVHIDEAIAMLDSRPELRQVLEEVKSRGLHLMSESKDRHQEEP